MRSEVLLIYVSQPLQGLGVVRLAIVMACRLFLPIAHRQLIRTLSFFGHSAYLTLVELTGLNEAQTSPFGLHTSREPPSAAQMHAMR